MNEIVKRTIWGALFVSIVIGSLLIGQYIPAIMFGGFMILGVIEFYQLFDKSRRVNPPIKLGVISATLLFAILVLQDLEIYRSDMYMVFVPIVFLTFFYVIVSQTKSPLLDMAIVSMSWVFITFSFFILYRIYSFNRSFFDNQELIIGFFILVWANDTFAYLVGRSAGKNKLIERISPKKTWEGTIGGFIMTILIAVIYAILTNHDYVFWVIAGAIVSPMAVIGDLIESKFKRDAKVKDSGSILPGHGGVLDRFDAAMFAAPFFYLLLKVYYI